MRVRDCGRRKLTGLDRIVQDKKQIRLKGEEGQ
jgi:hypothetical protein